VLESYDLPFKHLDSLFFALQDALVHTHNLPGTKFGKVMTQIFFFYGFNVHK
jgi:hypothetical protein